MKNKNIFSILAFCILMLTFFIYCFAQEKTQANPTAPPHEEAPLAAKESLAQPELAVVLQEAEEPVQLPVAQVSPPPQLIQASMPADRNSPVENVTLDFKEADIQNVLKIISYKSGVNIVTTPDVIGNVTIRLVDVPWEKAMDVILKTYGYAYERQDNIILVTKMENISRIQAEEPLKTEIFTLKFLDAVDAEKILIPLLSPRGKVSVLYSRGQKGWKFGTFKIGKEETKLSSGIREQEGTAKSETISIERNAAGDLVSKKAEFEPSIKSKVIIITDTAGSLDRIRNIILPQVDKKPKQVLIEARIMEVNRDKLKDLGFDWGTGSSGASGYTTAPGDIPLSGKDAASIAGRNLGSEFTPGKFLPIEGVDTLPGTYPYKAGLELIFKKLTGSQFEVILHALEEDANTNTLSSPRVLTLDNQEASILVGYHTPILQSSVTAGTDTSGPTQTQSLDYYQEIGIRLNVVPQISDEGFINMIIHPSVTSSTSSVTARNVAGTGTGAISTSVNYPVIDVREAQTQVLMRDGETIVLGGLLKDVKSKEEIGIPYLSKIPFLGKMFTRTIDDVSKVDLLICISARVLKDDEMLSSMEVKNLEQNLGKNLDEIQEAAMLRSKDKISKKKKKEKRKK